MMAAEWWQVIVAGVALISAVLSAGIWIGNVNSDRRSFREFMAGVQDEFREVRDELKGVRYKLSEVLEKISSATLKEGSPLRLTDKGQAISKMLRVREWAESTGSGLLPLVKGKRPYEIQEFCFDYAKEEFDPADEQEIKIKECAYENAVTRDEVLDVFAIELRDFLLKADNHREGSGSPTHAKGSGDSLHHA